MRLIAAPFSIFAIAIAGLLAGCASDAPSKFIEGPQRLTPCPSAPHCVSSQAAVNSPRHVAPLTYTGTAKAARQAFVGAITASSNATLETHNKQFVHAIFTSTLGFVDDVTAVFKPKRRRIDIKSESRLGYYDFGVNRHRVETLRQRFQHQMDQRH